jgi:hypothetical protein
MCDEPILPSEPADASGPALPSGRREENETDRAPAPRLPGDEGSSDGRLPGVPDDASAGSSPKDDTPAAPPPATPSSEKEDLQALIRRLTANDSLGEEVPAGYEHPGRYWTSVQAEDPFTPLLLDPTQYDSITDATVEHHARVVETFWREKIGFMERGGGGNIHTVYGDKSREKVRGYLQHVRSCKERIRDREDRRREAEDLLHRRREEAWRDLQSQIRFTLQGAEILSSQVASILDAAEEEGIERETARERLHRRFRSEGFEEFTSEDGQPRWMKPDEHERRHKERRAAQIPPIRIGPAAAQTIDDLIDLCDAHPEAARKSFYNGYVDQWVGGNYGDTDLAHELAEIRQGTGSGRARAVGLERAVRALSRHAGRPSTPQITLSRASIDLGPCAFGQQVGADISIRNASPRRMWGAVHLEGSVPGVTVTDRIAIGGDEIQLTLNTTEVEPGAYAGQVVLVEGGTATRHTVDLSYTVEPAQFSVEPESLHLGALGGRRDATVTVATDPTAAVSHLSAQWADAWDPSARASTGQEKDWRPVSEDVTRDDGVMTLDLTVHAKDVRDRRSYTNAIDVSLPNGQAVRIPFSFRRPWRYVVPASVVAGAVVFGSLFSVSREVMAEEAPVFRDWVLAPSLHPDVVLAAAAFTLVLMLVIGTPIGTSLWFRRRAETNE